MLIYRCDKCGKEMVFASIVGNTFAYTGHFVTLNPGYRTHGITDLCVKCYKAIEKSVARQAQTAEKAARKLIAEGLQT